MEELSFRGLFDSGPLPDPSRIGGAGIVEEIWSAYLDAVQTHLEHLERAALALEAGTEVEQNTAAIRRLLHSAKGDSGMAGLRDVYTLCHEAESAFDALPTSRTRADMVFRVKDWIQEALAFLRSHGVQAEATPPSSPVRREKIRTLVVDDDHLCRKRIRMLIESYCECTTARDGQKGYELFKTALEQGRPYQLVTLDIQMPRMDGHQTLAAIRRLEEQHGILGLDGVKIIMTTSHDAPEHVFAAFRRGCEAYVIKRDMGEKLLEEMAGLGLLRSAPRQPVG